MKRSNVVLLLMLIYGVFQFIVPVILPQNIINPNHSVVGILISMIIYMLLSIFGLYFKLEEKNISNKEVALIAIYSAFTAVSRIPFIAVPSFQPCTYLILVAGYVFGPLIGFVIGVNTALLSNFLVGQGPWTIYQMFVWGIVGLLGGSLGKYYTKKTPKSRDKQNDVKNGKKRENSSLNSPIINKWILVIIGFVIGIVYGWIMNIWSWLAWVPERSWESWFLYYIQSFPYDLIHAFANVIFLYFFGERTIYVLQRYHQRFLIVHAQIHEK